MRTNRPSALPRSRVAAGFTLVELLVVIAIIGILVALLLPAVQAARESSRRSQCSNNVKQIGLALHNYHDTMLSFPAAVTSAPAGGFGHSWSVAILPFIEYGNLYSQLDLKGVNNSSVGVVYTGYNSDNGKTVAGVLIKFLQCPSSPLPKWMHTTIAVPGPAGVFSPNYTAVTGSYDHSTRVDAKVNGNHVGWKSFGGALVPRQFKTFANITDGSSNTIVIGEQSDFCKTSAGAKTDCRSDWGHGFMTGVNSTGENSTWSFNHTAVKYAINTKAYNQTGIEGQVPANCPIQSAHPGGAHALLGDGSVRFAVQNLNLKLLYNLADCDDGNAIADF